jgi:hypothetical protein
VFPLTGSEARELGPPKRGISLRADIETTGVALSCGRSCNTAVACAADPLADGPSIASLDLLSPSALALCFLGVDILPRVASTSNSASTIARSIAGKADNVSSIIFRLSCMDFCILDVVPGIIDAANRRSSFIAEAYWPLWIRRTQTSSCIIGTDDGGRLEGGCKAYL